MKKVIKTRQVKLVTAKQVLAVLKKFFEKADASERGDLWDVLTGLRGPDDGDSDAKQATTCVIRSTVFGDEASIPATIDDDLDESVEVRRKMKQGVSDHFEHHARRAFEALGLKWNEYNEPKKTKPMVFSS